MPTPRGAYARRGAADPDAEIFAAALAYIRAVPAQPGLADLLSPQPLSEGVDWGALGITELPAWADAANPSMAALRAIEPAAVRPWRSTARSVQLQLADAKTPYVYFGAGRGAGKTWAAANALAEWALAERGNWAIVAPTFSDARQICVEGPSGILVALGDDLASYDKSKYELHLKNGSLIYLASDDAPARLRGKNLNGVWADELGSWKNLKETWDEGIEFATRIGSSRRLITTTPKRGNRIIKEFYDRAARGDSQLTMLRGRTMDNADNLSQTFLDTVRQRYEGSTLGRQELGGELLEEAEGALITFGLVEETRLLSGDLIPDLHRIVVGVDPAVSNNEGSDHTGIVVVGIGRAPRGWQPPQGSSVLQEAKHVYVLQDASLKASPEVWARRVLDVADEWAADAIVAEVNQGHDLVRTTVQLVARAAGLRTCRFISVTASRSKVARAEPVGGLWEQHRVHCVGTFPQLEDEWCTFVPGETTSSPDRLDASVWGVVGVMPELGMKARPLARIIAA